MSPHTCSSTSHTRHSSYPPPSIGSLKSNKLRTPTLHHPPSPCTANPPHHTASSLTDPSYQLRNTIMWEDNNPLAYDQSSPTESSFPPPGYDEDPSPPVSHDSDSDVEPPSFITRANSTPSVQSREGCKVSDDSEDDEDEEYRRMRREKGYSSRVEQMLLENKNVQIAITDAGKNHEGSGFIVYTIRTGVSSRALSSRATRRLTTSYYSRTWKFAGGTRNSSRCAKTFRCYIRA
jgi:hypothetical protein